MRTTLSRVAALLHPVAEDGFGFPALMAGRPARIDIGRVDRVEAGIEEGIEHCEGGRLVRGPAEDIAAEDERGDFEAAVSEFAFLHCGGSSAPGAR